MKFETYPAFLFSLISFQTSLGNIDTEGIKIIITIISIFVKRHKVVTSEVLIFR